MQDCQRKKEGTGRRDNFLFSSLFFILLQQHALNDLNEEIDAVLVTDDKNIAAMVSYLSGKKKMLLQNVRVLEIAIFVHIDPF